VAFFYDCFVNYRSDIMEIGTGKDAVPDATGVENPVTLEFTGTRSPHDTPVITQTGNVQATETPSIAAALLTPAVGGIIGAWLMMWSFLA